MDTTTVLEMLQDVAGRVIDPRFRSLDDTEIDHKGHPNDLVTVADREAEIEIASALRSAYPEAVVLGEEAYAADPRIMDRFLEADHSFTIDPIDGTKNFVEGSPDHAVMLSELRSGTVLRCWIWQPQHRTSFVAERGAGAWQNGRRMPRASRESGGGEPRLHTARHSWHGRPLDGLSAMKPTWLSCGVDYPRLAIGDADALIYRGRQMPWDHSPGSLLMTELGGHLGLPDGSVYEPTDSRPVNEPITLIAAANPAMFEVVAAGVRTSSLR